MKVLSEQGHDLRHFKGRQDPSRGPYADNPAIMEAFAVLYEDVIKTDQVVWCSLQRPSIVPLEKPRFLHTIDVDQRDVLAILDGFIWESGILGRRIVPPDVRHRITAACRMMVGGCRQEAIDAGIDEYLARELAADPWPQLLCSDTSCRLPQVLLKWPIRFSCVGQPEVVQLEQEEVRGHALRQEGGRGQGLRSVQRVLTGCPERD